MKQQIEQQISHIKNSGRAGKFIAYFQTYTNTNAPISRLKQLYNTITEFPEIIGLTIGTRPDCINTDVLDLIASYADRYEVWIEYGLQSACNATLQRINRGHTYEDFTRAIQQTHRYPIHVCTHLILGLPGEDHKEVMRTIRLVADSGIKGIKFHPLLVVRETELETMFRNQQISLLTEENYVQWIVDCIEHLPKDVVIQRVTADAVGDYLVAPDWCRDKMHVIGAIDLEMKIRNSFQGRKFNNHV